MNRITVFLVALTLVAAPALAANPCETLIKDRIEHVRQDPSKFVVHATVTAHAPGGTVYYSSTSLPRLINGGCSGAPLYSCSGDGLGSDDASLFMNNGPPQVPFDTGFNRVQFMIILPHGFLDGVFLMRPLSAGAPSAEIPFSELTCTNDLIYGLTAAGELFSVNLVRGYSPGSEPPK